MFIQRIIISIVETDFDHCRLKSLLLSIVNKKCLRQGKASPVHRVSADIVKIRR